MLFDFAIADIRQSPVVLTSCVTTCVQTAAPASGLASVHGHVPSCLRIHLKPAGFQVRCLARDYPHPIWPGLYHTNGMLKRGQWPSGLEVTESDFLEHQHPCVDGKPSLVQKDENLAEAGLYQIMLTCFREVEYVSLWTEGQQLLAQLDAAQNTHKAVDQLIGSAGCYMHPELLQHISETNL